MLQIQVYLRLFNLSSWVHLLVILMFLSGLTQVCGHLCDIALILACLIGQQYLAKMWQPRWVCLGTANCHFHCFNYLHRAFADIHELVYHQNWWRHSCNSVNPIYRDLMTPILPWNS